MLIVLILMMAFSAYSSVHSEQVEGWTATPVHKNLDILQKDADHDRIVFSPQNTFRLCFHKHVSCWIREKPGRVYYLCAVKNGVLFEYNLSRDNKGWKHLPETLTILRDFAENGGRNYFPLYCKSKFGSQQSRAIVNACKAAIRDLQYKQMEPDTGGWNFVFKHNQEMCEPCSGDEGGSIVWDSCLGAPQPQLEALKYNVEDTAWARFCGNQQYIYANIKGAMMVYNLSADDKLWKQNPDKLLWLKQLAEEGLGWNSREVFFFRTGVKEFIHTLIYGEDKESVERLLQKGLPFPNHQPDGWSVTLMRKKHADLLAQEDDLTISGMIKDGYFQDKAVWLRGGGYGKGALCSWRNGVFLRYNDINSYKRWNHLQRTQEGLCNLSWMIGNFGLKKTQCLLADNSDVEFVYLKNGCHAAVRDCLWAPIEELPGYSLIYPREDILSQREGDVIISLQECTIGNRDYGNKSIWVHLCSGQSFLRAVMEGSLFQCKINDEKNESCWADFPDTLAALKKICMSGHDKCLTFKERIGLRNSCKRLICKTLYNESIIELSSGWTLEKPHDLLLYNDPTCNDCTIQPNLELSKMLYNGAMWWRFDGQEWLCVRYNNSLLRYNLSSDQCHPTYKPSIEKLKDASETLFELGIECQPLQIDKVTSNTICCMGEAALEDHFFLINKVS